MSNTHKYAHKYVILHYLCIEMQIIQSNIINMQKCVDIPALR